MNDESTPKGAPETTGKKSATSVTLSAVKSDEYAERVDGAYVVVVKAPNGRLQSTRVFMTVSSAERAVVSATRRGRQSRIILAELRPLFVVTPGVAE